ncbi:c6 transcription factor protein [Rutstroemia sp. NJR-2017a BBW]|nr:c6 transcription factor protein [Rutstroemia sp. NJR-2017a BBW]
MSKITNIRNKIRYNLEHGIDPVLDYNNLLAAAEIDAGIRNWSPAWPAGDPRDNVGLLYRQMMWIYLWRSVVPPQTTNWKLDPRITPAVNDGIKLLSRFGPRDPSQTLILAPAFVIGCACFEEEQREPVRKAIKTVKEYMGYKNTDTALKVLEEDERSWDWQAIAARMKMDFIAT